MEHKDAIEAKQKQTSNRTKPPLKYLSFRDVARMLYVIPKDIRMGVGVSFLQWYFIVRCVGKYAIMCRGGQYHRKNIDNRYIDLTHAKINGDFKELSAKLLILKI